MKVTSFGTSVEKLLKILFKLISIEKVFNLGRTKYFSTNYARNGLIFRRVGIYCKGSGRFNMNFLCIESSKITKNIWPHWKYFECGQFFFELNSRISEKKDKGRNGTYAALQSTIWQIRSWNTTGIEKDCVIFSTQNDGIFK